MIESQIGVALRMYEVDASQRVTVEQLDVSQTTISRLFHKISIITFKTRHPRRVYKRSITDRISRRIAGFTLKLRRITSMSHQSLRSQSL